MKRTRRVIQDGFPECSVPRAELERIFAELRDERLAKERRRRPAAAEARKRARPSTRHQVEA